MLNGFMIFLIATEDPVSWSFAELEVCENANGGGGEGWHTTRDRTRLRANGLSDSERAEREMTRTHPNWLEVDISGGDLRKRSGE